MTRIKVLGLALVAVFAMTALSAASASANPIYYSCAKAAVKGTGHHEKGCNDAFKETGGGYNLTPGVGKGKVTKTKGGEATLHTVNPEGEIDVPVTCTKFKGSSTAVAPNLVVKAVTIFSKCKALSAPCENVKKETIETKPLAGNLGWINKAGKIAGTVLTSEAAPGSGIVAEFTCSAIGQIRTTGAVIGENKGNVGVINKASTLNFVPGKYLGKVEYAPGKTYEPIVNVPKFEGGPVMILLTEIKGAITGHPEEFYPPGGLPSGQQGVAENKGEALGIYEEGSE